MTDDGWQMTEKDLMTDKDQMTEDKEPDDR
jgi:hypothetical protein